MPPTGILVRLLYHIKSEAPLSTLLAADSAARVRLIADTIAHSGARMLDTFSAACVQHNPHIDYLKVPMHLGLGLAAVQRRCDDGDPDADLLLLLPAVRAHLELVDAVRWRALRYVDAVPLQRFVSQTLLCGTAQLQRYACMVDGLLGRAADCVRAKAFDGAMRPATQLHELLRCAELIVKHAVEQWHVDQMQRTQLLHSGHGAEQAGQPQPHQTLTTGWLRAVCTLLAHLAGRPGSRFDRKWNVHGRPLMQWGKQTQSSHQYAVWLANFVMMWRGFDADDSGAYGDADANGVRNVMVSDTKVNGMFWARAMWVGVLC